MNTPGVNDDSPGVETRPEVTPQMLGPADARKKRNRLIGDSLIDWLLSESNKLNIWSLDIKVGWRSEWDRAAVSIKHRALPGMSVRLVFTPEWFETERGLGRQRDFALQFDKAAQMLVREVTKDMELPHVYDRSGKDTNAL